MTHYAKVLDGIVTQVIVAEPEFFETFIDSTPGEWIQCSYNTRGNVHYLPNSDTPSGNSGLRGNYPGIGYIYDKELDIFIAPKPYKSWVLNNETATWEAPVAQPILTKEQQDSGSFYIWDEDNGAWKLEK